MTEKIVSGFYEVVVGVPDLDEAIAYLGQFGFHPGPRAALDAAASRRLYGHESACRSVRMLHGNADHGLARLIQWERPSGDGLGTGPMRAIGSRWSNNHTLRVARVYAHAATLRRHEQPIHIHGPDFAGFGQTEAERRPFQSPITGVMEVVLLRPIWRQAFFERVDYPSPLFGTIDERSIFQTSQFTHVGLTTKVDPGALDFYDRVLGMQRVLDMHASHAQLEMSRGLFDLAPGEGMHTLAFDEPRSGPGLEKRSGRILIFNLEPGSEAPDVRPQSRPGELGYSAYVFGVADIDSFAADARAFGGVELGDVMQDEFGDPTLRFTTPDGYMHMAVQA